MVDVGSGDHSSYAAALRRMIRAAGRRYGAADPYDLPELVALRVEVELAIHAAVREQRTAGTSWAAIADALGITKQGAQQRYGE